MIKHIFCDLDGTLLRDFHKIYDHDIKTLQIAQDKGMKISIATGRLDYEIKMLMEKYQFKGYRVSQNGAVVFNDRDELVYENTLKTEDIKKILKALADFNIIIFFQTADTYFVQKKVPIVENFEKSQSFITYVENENILNELEKHDFVTISLWAEENENIKIKEALDQVLPKHLVTYVSSKYTIDITSAVNSKGNAIKHLSEIVKIPMEEIAVIGDSHNDISMFQVTDHSFVMDEADLEVKQHATYQVKDVSEAVLKMMK